MTQMFDSKEFIKELAQDLVSNFDKASKATTPGLKGAAKENEVRRKLGRLLPSGVGVGTVSPGDAAVGTGMVSVWPTRSRLGSVMLLAVIRASIETL